MSVGARAAWLVVAFSSCWLACISRPKLPLEPLALGARERLPIAIELRLDPALSTVRWKWGDYELLPAKNFSQQAEEVARAAFADVVVASTGSTTATPNPNGTGLPTLHLELVAYLPSMSLWAGQEQVHTVLLKWKLVDAGGRLVWIETIQGEDKGAMGTSTSQDDKAANVASGAIRDGMRRSYKVMVSSVELQRFERR